MDVAIFFTASFTARYDNAAAIIQRPLDTNTRTDVRTYGRTDVHPKSREFFWEFKVKKVAIAAGFFFPCQD